MQREIVGTRYGYGRGAISYGSNNAFSSAPLVNQSNGYDFASNLFPPNPPHLLVDLNDDYSSFGSSQPVETMTSCLRHLDLDLDLSQQPYHQDLMDRHRTLVSRLREVSRQAHDLRQENINLKMANVELNNQLNLLLDAASFRGIKSNVDDSIAEERENHAPGYDDVVDGSGDHESPTSVMDSSRAESSGPKVDRVVLPKSISVRSSGYLKGVQGGGSSGGRTHNKGQNMTKPGNGNAPQRVYVPGGKEEEQPLELEVYNQGMFKTELCNKWQQTGACPYGDNCQFAHGIGELRPILRHPRYKTEVCRMVLNGDPCPYGHRCHFRHTLTDEEKLMRTFNARSLKSLNR